MNRHGHVELQFSPPQDATQIWPAEDASFGFEGDLNSATTLQAVLTTRWDVLDSESDVSNPLQLKSYMQVKRFGVCAWRGLIFERSLLEEANGVRTVRVRAIDMVGWLKRLLAVWQGNGRDQYIFTLATPPLYHTSVDLHQLDAIGDAQWVYAPEWPGTADPASSSMWLPNASVASVEITQDIDGTVADGDSIRGPLIGSAGSTAMLPGGIFRVTSGGNTEWIQYDGYIGRNDGYNWFNRIKRAVCGTSTHNYSSGVTAYQCQSKRVSPVAAQELTGTRTSATEVIADKHYEINADDGFVYFRGNPAQITPDEDEPYTSFDIVEYATFDETNASAFPTGRLLLSYLMAELFESTTAAAGPGWTTSDYEISLSPDIVLSRFQLRDSEFLGDLLEMTFEQLGLNKGSSTDAVGIFDRASDSKVCVHSITQSDTPDYTFEEAHAVASDTSLESINGAILVNYHSAQPRQLASAARTWFSEFNGGGNYEDGTIGSNNQKPDGYMIAPVSTSDPSWSGVLTFPSLANHLHANRLYDGDENTGLGLAWTEAHNPGSDAEVFFCHFSDTANEVSTIKRIRINYDMAAASSATNLASLRVYGLTGFTPGTTSAKPTYTSRFEISASLRQKYAEGNTESFSNAVLEADNLGVDCEAIVLVWDGMPTYDGYRMARIREILVEGWDTQQVLVQITDSSSASNDATMIYAPITYAKIYDNATGLPLADKIDVGVASRNAAISFGRLALVQALALGYVKQFEITSEFVTIPDFGDTVRFFPNTPDEYTGVVIGKSYFCKNEETLTLSVIDFRAEIFGT